MVLQCVLVTRGSNGFEQWVVSVGPHGFSSISKSLMTSCESWKKTAGDLSCFSIFFLHGIDVLHIHHEVYLFIKHIFWGVTTLAILQTFWVSHRLQWENTPHDSTKTSFPCRKILCPAGWYLLLALAALIKLKSSSYIHIEIFTVACRM